MRQIEKWMNRQIYYRQDRTTKGNTEVVMEQGSRVVRLHGNPIIMETRDAIYGETAWSLSSCGWKTNTTKSRLNAFLTEFDKGAFIYQKDFEWYISDGKFTTEFYDGIVIPLDTPPYVPSGLLFIEKYLDKTCPKKYFTAKQKVTK
jgi:hypothetical protein